MPFIKTSDDYAERISKAMSEQHPNSKITPFAVKKVLNAFETALYKALKPMKHGDLIRFFHLFTIKVYDFNPKNRKNP